MEMKPQIIISAKQQQIIVMTPKLQQAIKILQMPRMELSQYLTQQLMDNPVLEEVDDEIEEYPESETDDDFDEVESEIDLETGLSETDSAADNDLPELDIIDDNFGDIDWKDYFELNGTGSSGWEEPEEDNRRNNDAVVEETLQDHLLWQLRMSIDSALDYEIGNAIIGEIDDDGYLATDVNDIAESFGFNIDDVERVLALIQVFDPVGCGSKNPEECLLIQLRQFGLEDSLAFKLVEGGYLEDLGANKYPQVAKSLGVSIDEIQAAVEEIKIKLEPKPGHQFSPIRNEYITPDVIVENIDGKYEIRVPDSGPGLRISSYYRDYLSSGKQTDDDTRKYIQSNIESALWVLESVESRRKTILKVTEAIFEIQKEYLDKGDEALKPLTLREIADMVGIHESTVSRAVRNRYVQTPQGIENLKHFFGSGLSTKSGEMTSSTSVKETIKEIVENENPKKPLSDSDIGKALSQKGIKIARRTIAKYREELNIPPSNKRKQW